jgi:nitrate reductase NapAB chaperone NapD
MPISGYIVIPKKGAADSLIEELNQREDVEVGIRNEKGFAMVAATTDDREAKAFGKDIEQLETVESATLVYHNFEDIVTQAATSA